MQLYAQHPALRTRQLAADLGMLAWVVLWVLVARTVHGAVLVLAEPGQAVEDLGRSVGGNMESAAGAAEDVPVVGDELSAPFDALADAGGSVSGAGQAAQDAVGTLADGARRRPRGAAGRAGCCCAGCPGGCGWPREARRRGASCSTGTPDLELLAARALATAPLPRLAALPAGTGAAWRAGDPAAVRALAALELAGSACACRRPRSGVRRVTASD